MVMRLVYGVEIRCMREGGWGVRWVRVRLTRDTARRNETQPIDNGNC